MSARLVRPARRLVGWALAAALLPAAATPLVPAAASDALARATLVSGERRIAVLDRSLGADGIERRFTEDGRVLYRSRIRPMATGFDVAIVEGHPSQRGRFVVDAGRLSVFDGDGRPAWSQPLADPLCLPELLGEFVRAHWDRLAPGDAPLRCGTPILKASKVAPLQLRRLPDTADGRRVVEVGPGSLGMRLFMVPTRLTFAADGGRLLAHDGQFEAPRRVEGSAAYLRGQAVYDPARPVADWPAARFAPAATGVR